MAQLVDHPTVRAVAAARHALPVVPAGKLSGVTLRQWALDAGADDVGFVSLDRAELDDQRADILAAFPAARALVSVVVRMNRDPIRSPARSVANLEFHDRTDHVTVVTRELVSRLEREGVRALNAAAGFPMEMNQFPSKGWIVSHKPVAVAAGLGRMGIHRNVIHPRFGNFVLLGTVILAAEIDEESRPIDYNPCLECKLCVAACPVGAVKADGGFDAAACMTHNYREFMSGFTDWVEKVADAKDARDYRRKVTDGESASMWQSLSFGANYKAAYCMAVCPAGSEVIGPFLDDKPAFVAETLKPLQQKREPVYVIPKSDAAEHVAKRFPHKQVRHVSGIRPTTIDNFLGGLHIVFNPGRARDLDAVFHFTFTGDEPTVATVTIRGGKLGVARELLGKADCTVVADSKAWLGFLRKDRGLVWSIVRGKIRVSGRRRLLGAFARCFPA
jgi:NAD-dependent dihydropyrimidine dehydrogenase PreA subunit